MKVFVSIPKTGNVAKTFLTDEVRELMASLFEVEYSDLERNITQDEFKAAVKDADVVMTGWGHPQITYDMVKGTNIKAIAHTGGSVGSLVTPDIYDIGIMVMSGNLMYADCVAEGTIAYMLMALRRIPDYIENVRNGDWRTEASMWDGLLDRTVGIVGVGTISRIVIRMLQPFRVKIKVFSHYKIEPEFLEKYGAEAATLDEIFSTCDVVSVHSALNDENRGLIGKRYFEMLKDGSLFLNTSRGRVIDEEALIEELEKNRFRAVLDVFWKEPLATDSKLRSLKNVYCIPHMAGPTLDRRKYITKALIDDMRAFFNGAEKLDLEISEEFAKRMTKA